MKEVNEILTGLNKELKQATPVQSISGNNKKELLCAQYDMIVFSHLRWEFVFQRPQHIITRLSKNRKILFVEEPVPYSEEEKDTARIINAGENIKIMQPMVDSIEDIAPVLRDHLTANLVSVGWFYSAAFSPLLDSLNFEKVVYDCMDELTLFKGASPELIRQEKLLLVEADIVFTGGKSLYEAKRKVHDNVYCLPSSVEKEHFEQALNGIAVPNDIADLPKPVVGYYGVIDERIDMDLLSEVAHLHPEVSFVMIGPLAKISDDELARSPNIHYLGMRTYESLPYYLKGIDIAMMPFAMNESTRFISPTKTLEFMAARKPIISTPVRDVVRDYKDDISIVTNAREFSDALNDIQLQIKTEDSPGVNFDHILDRTSWDNTAARMEQLINETTHAHGKI
ncbi:MAG: tuaH [Bacteroidota bacterium]|nr:tuaH [Bacteroidota bacterium]